MTDQQMKKIARTISNENAREIKTLNNALKKQHLPSLCYGLKALERSQFAKSAAAFADLQEAFGKTLIVANQQCKIFGQRKDLSDFAYFALDITDENNGVKNKFDLLLLTQELLDYFKNKILTKNKKNRTQYEKEILDIQFDDLYSEFPHFQDHAITPYDFFSKVIANHIAKKDPHFINPFSQEPPIQAYALEESWLLTAKDKKGLDTFVYGESQQHLAYYLANTEYLQQHQIEIPLNAQMKNGWDKVIMKKGALSQNVPQELAESCFEYNAIENLNNEYVKKSRRVLEWQKENLIAKLNSSQYLGNDVTCSSEGFWQNAKQKVKNYLSQKRDIKKIKQQINALSKMIRKSPVSSNEDVAMIDNKIAAFIDSYDKFKHALPAAFFEHYFVGLAKSEVLDNAQNKTLSLIIKNIKEFNITIPDSVLKSYMSISQENADRIFDAQPWLKSPMVDNLIAEKQEKERANSPEVLGIKQSINELVEDFATYKKTYKKPKKSKKDKNKQSPALKKLSERVQNLIENFEQHQQNIPLSLLEIYFDTVNKESLKDPITQDMILNDNQIHCISILVAYADKLMPTIPKEIMKAYLNAPHDQYRILALLKAQSILNSEDLNIWLLQNAPRQGTASLKSNQNRVSEFGFTLFTFIKTILKPKKEDPSNEQSASNEV